MNNYEFYNLKPKKKYYLYTMFIIMITTILYYIFNYNSYDKKTIVGLNSCQNKICEIKITLNYEEMKILDQQPRIEYQHKKIKIKKILYSEPYLSNSIPVSDVTIIVDDLSNNNIIEFKLEYNKQKIIKKIKNILERN